MTAAAIARAPLDSERQQHRILDLVLDRLSSQNSKIAYARALIDFLDWYDGQRRPVLSKAVVQRYRATLLDADLAPLECQPEAVRHSGAGCGGRRQRPARPRDRSRY